MKQEDDSAKSSLAGGVPKPASPGRIELLTSGGDAPGMNAAIRAVVRVAVSEGLEVLGARRGFDGLIYGHFQTLSSRDVANIIQRGGTVLETSRSPKFLTREGRLRAAENLRYWGAEALVVIGGDGAAQGAIAFAADNGMNVMVVPASIDNDVAGSDYAIGFDTAVNTALGAIDRIRDTAAAIDRLFFIEVMGRDSGFIALEVALASGAEALIVPEIPTDLDQLCQKIEQSRMRGKRSSIIVVCEGPRTGGAIAIADAVAARIAAEARVVVLGHIQRGGTPSARDRTLASRMGAAAVRAIIDGRQPSLIGEHRGSIVCVPLAEAAERRRSLDQAVLELVGILSI